MFKKTYYKKLVVADHLPFVSDGLLLFGDGRDPTLLRVPLLPLHCVGGLK